MMMQLIRITTPGDTRLQQLVPLYEEAFPETERRKISQLQRLIHQKPEMYFNAIEMGDRLAGLFIYWDMSDFYYLEHLAVFPAMRDSKIGQQVLDYIAANLPGPRLLEVEPPVDELTTRRVNYYRRNGYEVLDKSYMQLSYDKNEEVANLWIMANQSTPRLSEFVQTIKQIAYLDNMEIE